ncbi:hypothetical protein [Cellulomonas gilvus]|uniref:HNH endonuclease n=1 Tax=Cellulomonas gilvus (strain ATCC 13127 / NRRL B-14078) TaxID=593907 RepID=F8A4F3_CELGA|nr:hypothetical protein [Cellulomonas gilvus]AEI12059.1 hypothetical protein Celgi_1547 [Cellulomonas gilvus ATCC 13127]
MLTYFGSRQEAEARVVAQEGLSPAAAVVASTVSVVFGRDVAATLSPARQPLATVEPRQAMYAVIGGLRCTLYADPKIVNVRTPGVDADAHLRAHAKQGDAVIPNPQGNATYAGVRYADPASSIVAPDLDAESILRQLVGTQLYTVSGSVNRVIRVRPPSVIVATTRSPEGQPVPIADVAAGLELLHARGIVEVTPDVLGYRSAFVGAVLSTIPGTRVVGGSPVKVALAHDDEVPAPESRVPELVPGPFQGDLDRPVTAKQRREQRRLRQVLLAGRADASCSLCGETYPARFLWASHIKRRSAATPDELRDLGRIAMLACVFGCDALFEDGYVTVRDGVIAGTSVAGGPSAIGHRIAAIAGRAVVDYETSASYFEWHDEHIFRGQDA